MTLDTISITNELPEHAQSVEELSAIAFGPGRFTRSAFRLRENIAYEPDLSFVAHDAQSKMVGSVRLTKILIGEKPAILLGPLVVVEDYKNKGLGALLMKASLDAAKQYGHDLVLLVGDLPYYERFGFKVSKPGKIGMPAPVAKHRLLICELKEGAAEVYSGEASRFAG